MIASKVCAACGEEKPITHFYVQKPNGFRRKCKPCTNKESAEWAANNPEKVKGFQRTANLKKKYNIKKGKYEELHAAQNGVCAICGNTTIRRGVTRELDVDHCHLTGRVRGLLCDMCNKAIGMFKDDPIRLRQAAAYLEAAK